MHRLVGVWSRRGAGDAWLREVRALLPFWQRVRPFGGAPGFVELLHGALAHGSTHISIWGKRGARSTRPGVVVAPDGHRDSDI